MSKSDCLSSDICTHTSVVIYHPRTWADQVLGDFACSEEHTHTHISLYGVNLSKSDCLSSDICTHTSVVIYHPRTWAHRVLGDFACSEEHTHTHISLYDIYNCIYHSQD